MEHDHEVPREEVSAILAECLWERYHSMADAMVGGNADLAASLLAHMASVTGPIVAIEMALGSGNGEVLEELAEERGLPADWAAQAQEGKTTGQLLRALLVQFTTSSVLTIAVKLKRAESLDATREEFTATVDCMMTTVMSHPWASGVEPADEITAWAAGLGINLIDQSVSYH